MTFSIEQMFDAYFDNTGGGGVWYGGTGTSGSITGSPTGGSGTGSSYPTEAGSTSGTGGTDAAGDSQDGAQPYLDLNLVYDPGTGQTVSIITGEEMVFNLSPNIIYGEELVIHLNSDVGNGQEVPVFYGEELVLYMEPVDTAGGGTSGDQTGGETVPESGSQKLTVQISDKTYMIDGAVGTAGNDQVVGNGMLFGGGGDDLVAGGAGTDFLDGGSGDDILFGNAGNDFLAGGTGNNILEGGAGADVLDGTNGYSVASYRNAQTGVTVHLDTSGQGNAGDEAAGDVYINIAGVWGSTHDDILVGDGNANSLFGDDGTDLILGGAGADRLDGGAGRDTLSYFDAQGGVTVRLYQNTVSGDIAQGDTISGFEDVSGGHGNDWLFGSAEDNILDGCDGGDFLIGLGGNDLLLGGNGDDTLIADWGTDILEGGAGNDLFAVWNTIQHAIVNDFVHGQDHVQIQQSWFGSYAELYAAAVQQGSDVVIARNGLDLTLKGIQLSTLAASDFQFA